MKNSPCLHSEVKLSKSYREKCVQGIQAGFEHIMQYESRKTIFTCFCCVYNRWEACIKQHLYDYCGPEAPQIIVDLIHAGSMHVLTQLCPPSYFDPELERCTSVLPPLYTKPKGAKSDSFASWMFSWSCPNVGYGITD